MEGPLHGVRVLDLTTRVAGPSGTQLLGDFGAEVIKIEPPHGEPLRSPVQAGPRFNDDNFIFLAYNRNKKSICLDLYTEGGREAFYDLVKVSDVVYDNFRPRVMGNLRADYDRLAKINPRIICFSASGFGSTGPYRDRPGVDVLAQAESGLMSLTGLGDEPVRCAPSIIDICTGLFGALGVMAALQQRERTGRGQKVESSLLNVAVCLMTYQIVYYMISGVEPPRLGNGHLAAVPSGAYKCKDGRYVALGSCWPRIARTIGEEWLIDDPRFKEANNRSANRKALDEILGQAFAKMNAEEWLEILRLDDINSAPVNTVSQVVEHPQVLDQQMIVRLVHALGGEFGVIDNPVKMSEGMSADRYAPPPLLGQHTVEVLSTLLGYSEERIAQLRGEQEGHAVELEKHTIKHG